MHLTAASALRVLRERWWLPLGATLLAAVAAYGYTVLPWTEPRWKASVWIQATGQFEYGNTLALERQLQPLAERIRQSSVMREVDRNLQLDLPPEKLLDETKAQPVQNSSQIRIDVEDPSPDRAQQVAMEIAAVYTAQHNALQQGELRERQVIFDVLDRPTTPTLVWPLRRMIVPAAALLGLLAAGGVLLLLAALDDTLRSAEDVRLALDLPVIGTVPAARTPVSRRSEPLPGPLDEAQQPSLTRLPETAGTRR